MSGGGIDADQDGTLDLVLAGSSWDRKDLFVEFDWMATSGHSHEPSAASLDEVKEQFAAAPIVNDIHPTDSARRGIALHLENGGDATPEITPIRFFGPSDTLDQVKLGLPVRFVHQRVPRLPQQMVISVARQIVV